MTNADTLNEWIQEIRKEIEKDEYFIMNSNDSFGQYLLPKEGNETMVLNEGTCPMEPELLSEPLLQLLNETRDFVER